MDFQLIRAYCAKDLEGVLKPGHSWMSKPGDRWYELEFQVLMKHYTGAKFLSPRMYAAAVCFRDVETIAHPFEPTEDYPDLTVQDVFDISRIVLADSLRKYMTHLSPSEAAPLVSVHRELKNFAINAAHLYPKMEINSDATTFDGQLESNGQPSDAERRLSKLRMLGGSSKYTNNEWTFKGIALLVKSEKEERRKRGDEKTIRADLKEAAQSELDAKRAGLFKGLGQR